ncbi:DUF222 domain-containing protein [Kocuria sp. M1R5S2]|uniref:HNH endonuclease signature motif containing protein n=1 Tax=Kocuria rhizosphaerae TaxID=3376285 RepID=UPI0037B45352
MTTTVEGPREPEEPFPGDPLSGELLPEDPFLAVLEQDYAQAAVELLGQARAEAEAAGRQVRVIHRMWVLQEAAHARHRAARARWLNARARRLGRRLPELENRTLLEVAEEIGPGLNLPAVTAIRRVEQAIILVVSLPDVLAALEAGTIGVRQAEVIAELWRELVGGQLSRAPDPGPPVGAVREVVGQLLERAPVSTVAQLKAAARRLRDGLPGGTGAARHRAALGRRRVWVEAEEDGMARLCAILDAATAHAAHHRLSVIAARVHPQDSPEPVPAPAGTRPPIPAGTRPPIPAGPGPDLGSGPGGGWGEDLDEGAGARTAGQLRADVLADLLLAGEPAQMPEHLRGIRGHVTLTVPALALLAHTTPAPHPGAPAGEPAPGASAPGGADPTGLPGTTNSGTTNSGPPTSGTEGSSTADSGPPKSGPPNSGTAGSGTAGSQGAVSGGAVSGGADSGGAGAWPAGLPVATGCAELAGHGPIPMEVAARIAATAPTWTRVLTHPVTGTVLEHDRTTYTVPADLRRRLRLRDGTCRFPGCRRAAESCDLDHTIAWAQGGTTDAGNLAHLCRAHHLLKHRHGPLGRWRVVHRDPATPEGVLEWTSPAGRIHVTYPQHHHHPLLSPVRIHDPLSPDRFSEDPPPPEDLPPLPPGPLPLDEPPPF